MAMKRARPGTMVAKQPPAKKRAVQRGDYQKGRELARNPRAELKAFDLSTATQNFVNAGVVIPTLNACVNGAELYQRVGRKTYGKSIHIRGFVQNILTSVQDFARIIVFYDSQPNAAAATAASILSDSNAGAATTATSEINLNNRQRFKILRDHQMILPSVTFTAGVLTNEAFQQSDNQLNINMYIKLKGLETVYNGNNAGTVADITSGNIGMLLITSLTNNSWQLQYGTRYRYYD